METVRVGVVGLGIGKLHARAILGLQKKGGAELTAVCDQDQGKQEVLLKLYEELGIPGPWDSDTVFYTDFDEMLGNAELDAVTIAVPNHLHPELACAALKAGKHVLCEKPLANTLAGARKMAKMAENHPGQLAAMMMNNNMRPEFGMIADMIEHDELGDIRSIRACWERRKGIPFRGMWFTDKSRSGGGPVIDLAPHLLGFVLGLMGWPTVTNVHGWTWCDFGAEGSGDGPYGGGTINEGGVFDVEDSAMAKLVLEGNVPVDIRVSWARNVSLESMGFEIIGSHAGVVMNRRWPINDGDDEKAVDSLWVVRTAWHGGMWVPEDTILDPNSDPGCSDPWMGRLAYVEKFVQAVRSNDVSGLATFEQGLQIQAIIDAWYRSADMEKGVTLITK